MKEILEVRAKVRSFSQEIRSGQRKGATGKTFDRVLNIGIGGSLLGLLSAYEALKSCADVLKKGDHVLPMNCISNVDPADFGLQIKDCNPQTVLVIISSKSFTTMETCLNLNLVKEWLLNEYKTIDPTLDEETILKKHLVASTSNVEAAKKSGFEESNIFKFWDWVGGRYSVFSL